MFLKGEMWIRLQPGSSKSSIALDCLPLKFFFVYFPPSLLPFGGTVIMIQRNLVHLLNVATREYRGDFPKLCDFALFQ